MQKLTFSLLFMCSVAREMLDFGVSVEKAAIRTDQMCKKVGFTLVPCNFQSRLSILGIPFPSLLDSRACMQAKTVEVNECHQRSFRAVCGGQSSLVDT